MNEPVFEELIKGVKTFDRFYDFMKTETCRIYEKDKRVGHTLILVMPDGNVEVVDFDDWVDRVKAMTGADEEHAKAGVFQVFSKGIKDLGIVGFLDIFEAWSIHSPMEDGLSEEEAQERFLEMRKKYGLISDIPTKIEVLCINGRFKDHAYFVQWKINRRDGTEVWLSPVSDIKEKDDARRDSGRQGWMHAAVMGVVRSSKTGAASEHEQ